MTSITVPDSRLVPPTFAVRLVERPRILQALLERREPITVIEAPPGFGKTAVLAQLFAAGATETPVWLSLDVGDSASLILDQLEAGFAGAGLAPPQPAAAQGGAIGLRLNALVAAIERSNRRWRLILDNVEHIGAEARREIVEPLARFAQDALRLAIACSGPLPLDVSGPGARGLVAWIGPDDLRFTVEDTRAVCGRSVTDYRVRHIQQQTLGWPLLVGVMAAADNPALAGRGRPGARTLDNFLHHRLLAQLDPKAARDSARLAALERFDAELVERLLGRSWTRRWLDQLKALGMVTPVTAEEGLGLGFNPVIRGLLRAMAGREAPEELEAFARRAIADLSRQGRHVSAARVAVLLGDEDLIVQVVEACDPARMMFGEGVSSLRKILRLIPPDLQRRQPRIGYARIICWIKTGDLAEAAGLFDELEAGLAASGGEAPEGVQLDRQLCRLMIATYAGLPLTFADIEDQRRLVEIDPAVAPMVNSMTDTLLCYVLQRDGRFAEARAAAESAIAHANGVGSDYAAFFMYCDIAMMLGVQGEVAQAFGAFQAGERACQQALRQDERLGMIRDVFRLELQHELDPDDMSQAERLRTICRRLPRLEGWPDVFAAAYRTYSEKLAITGDIEAALAVVQTGLDFAAAQRIVPLSRMLIAQRTLLLAWSRRLGEAGAALAEMTALADGVAVLSWREMEAMAEARAALDLARSAGGQADGPNTADLEAALDRARRTGARRSGDRFAAWLRRLGRPAATPAASPFHRTGRLIDAFVAGGGEAASPCYDPVRRDRPELFTAHERRVLEKLGEGLSDKAIGLELGISAHGVRYHLKRIYAQLNVSTRAQAWERARMLGLGAPY